ncbi:MAG: PqqD family peptide modification chaperone [Propioniciclava sp.]
MRYLRPGTVAWHLDVLDTPVLYLCQMPDGRPFELNGSAAAAWVLAVELQDHEAVLEELVASHQGDPTTIEREATVILNQLVDTGMLEVDKHPHSGP